MDFDIIKSMYMKNRIHFIDKDMSPKRGENVSCIFECCMFKSEGVSVSYNHHLSLFSS